MPPRYGILQQCNKKGSQSSFSPPYIYLSFDRGFAHCNYDPVFRINPSNRSDFTIEETSGASRSLFPKNSDPIIIFRLKNVTQILTCAGCCHYGAFLRSSGESHPTPNERSSQEPVIARNAVTKQSLQITWAWSPSQFHPRRRVGEMKYNPPYYCRVNSKKIRKSTD